MKILRDSRDVGSHVGVSLSEPLLMQNQPVSSIGDAGEPEG